MLVLEKCGCLTVSIWPQKMPFLSVEPFVFGNLSKHCSISLNKQVQHTVAVWWLSGILIIFYYLNPLQNDSIVTPQCMQLFHPRADAAFSLSHSSICLGFSCPKPLPFPSYLAGLWRQRWMQYQNNEDRYCVHWLFPSPFPLSSTMVAHSRYPLYYLSSLFWYCIHLWRHSPAK